MRRTCAAARSSSKNRVRPPQPRRRREMSSAHAGFHLVLQLPRVASRARKPSSLRLMPDDLCAHRALLTRATTARSDSKILRPISTWCSTRSVVRRKAVRGQWSRAATHRSRRSPSRRAHLMRSRAPHLHPLPTLTDQQPLRGRCPFHWFCCDKANRYDARNDMND